jgi:hypothetical protein
MNESAFSELSALVERAVRPLKASRSAKSKMRAELLAHVVEVFDEEVAALGDERLALERTAQRFGDTAVLTAGLQETITLGGHMLYFVHQCSLRLAGNIMMNHNRIYNALLATLSLWVLGGMWPLLLFLQMPPDARPPMHLPDWLLPYLAVINMVYLVAMIVTLISRLAHPPIGNRLTTAMNVLFLFGPPLGTVLGIYGFWKVDKNLKRAAAAS